MKDVIIYWPRWYPFIGGITTHIDELISGMPENRFRIITNKIEGQPAMERFRKNAQVKRVGPDDLSLHHPRHDKLPKYRYPGVALADFIRLKRKMRLIKKYGHDVLHVHGPVVEPNLFHLDSITGTRLFTSRIDFSFDSAQKVLTCHGLASHYSDDSKVRETEKRLLNMFDRVICVDEYVHEGARELLDDGEKAVFIPNPVDTDKFTYSPPGAGGKLNVGFIGRLTEERGLGILGDLIRNLPEYCSLTLIVAGPVKKVRGLKSSLKGRDVRLHANVSPDRLPGLIREMDILFNPVIYEGSSRATLEAFSCGRPAIMLDAGNRYPLIDGVNGYLIKEDISDFLRVLEEINADRSVLNSMSMKARKVVEKEYSNRVLIPKIREIYEGGRT